MYKFLSSKGKKISFSDVSHNMFKEIKCYDDDNLMWTIEQREASPCSDYFQHVLILPNSNNSILDKEIIVEDVDIKYGIKDPTFFITKNTLTKINYNRISVNVDYKISTCNRKTFSIEDGSLYFDRGKISVCYGDKDLFIIDCFKDITVSSYAKSVFLNIENLYYKLKNIIDANRKESYFFSEVEILKDFEREFKMYYLLSVSLRYKDTSIDNIIDKIKANM